MSLARFHPSAFVKQWVSLTPWERTLLTTQFLRLAAVTAGVVELNPLFSPHDPVYLSAQGQVPVSFTYNMAVTTPTLCTFEFDGNVKSSPATVQGDTVLCSAPAFVEELGNGSIGQLNALTVGSQQGSDVFSAALWSYAAFPNFSKVTPWVVPTEETIVYMDIPGWAEADPSLRAAAVCTGATHAFRSPLVVDAVTQPHCK